MQRLPLLYLLLVLSSCSITPMFPKTHTIIQCPPLSICTATMPNAREQIIEVDSTDEIEDEKRDTNSY